MHHIAADAGLLMLEISCCCGWLRRAFWPASALWAILVYAIRFITSYMIIPRSVLRSLPTPTMRRCPAYNHAGDCIDAVRARADIGANGLRREPIHTYGITSLTTHRRASRRRFDD